MNLSASGLEAELTWNQRAMSITSVDFATHNNNAKAIELRIQDNFRCYVILVWVGAVLSILFLVTSIVLKVSVFQGIISVFAYVVMAGACILALLAKASFDSVKQRIVFFLFCISSILSVISTSVYLITFDKNKDDLDSLGDDELEGLVDSIGDRPVFIFAIIFIPIQLFIGLGLILNAARLTRLMVERDKILLDISVKRNAAIVAAL